MVRERKSCVNLARRRGRRRYLGERSSSAIADIDEGHSYTRMTKERS